MAFEENVIISFREGNSDFEKAIERIDKRLSSIEKKFDDVDDSIEDTNKSTKELSKNIESVDKSSSKLQSTFKAAAKVFAVAFSVNAAANFAKEISKIAVEIESIDKKTKIVFGDFAGIIESAAKDSAKSLGLTTSEFQNAAAAAGDLLIPLGFGREQAADFSVELVGLSGALSEWTAGQFTSAETSQILTKALLGETEQLKSLGIAINQSDINARLAEKGQEKLTGQLLKQAKAQAVLELITQKSTDAQTAFRENGDSLVRTQAELNASIRQFRETVARELTPTIQNVTEKVVVPLVDKIGALIIALFRLPRFIKENRDAFILLGVAIAALNLNAIISTVRTLTASFVAYTRSIATATTGTTLFSRAFAVLNKTIKANQIGIAIAAVASLTAGFLLLRNRSKEVAIELGKVGDELDDISKIGGRAVFDRIANQLSEATGQVVSFNDVLAEVGSTIPKLSLSELEAFKLFLEDELTRATIDADNALGELNQNAAKSAKLQISDALDLVNKRLGALSNALIKTDSDIKSFAVGSLLDLQSQFEANEAAIKSFKEKLAGIDPNDANGIDVIQDKIQSLTEKNKELEQSIISLSDTLLNDFIDGSLADLRSDLSIAETQIEITKEGLANLAPDDVSGFDKYIAKLKEFEDQAKSLSNEIELLESRIRRANEPPLPTDPLKPIQDATIQQTKNQEDLNLEYRKTQTVQEREAALAAKRQSQLQENTEVALNSINQIGSVSSELFSLTSSIFQQRLQQDEELFRRGLISEKELARRKAEIAQKQFKAQKAQTLVEISLSIAQGIAAAIAASPLTGGLPFTAIVASLGAAQLAIAAAQKPPPIPAFKHGVINLQGKGTSTSDSIDAKLSRGESVMTAKETQRHMIALEAMRANNFHDRFIDLKNIKPSDYKNIINSTDIIKPFNVLKSESKPVNIVNKLNNKDLIQNTNNNFNKQNYLLKSVKMSIDELNKNINQKSASSYAV